MHCLATIHTLQTTDTQTQHCSKSTTVSTVRPLKYNKKLSCSTMEQVCQMTSSRVTHCHISVVDSKYFYLDSHILLFCF